MHGDSQVDGEDDQDAHDLGALLPRQECRDNTAAKDSGACPADLLLQTACLHQHTSTARARCFLPRLCQPPKRGEHGVDCSKPHG